MILEPIARTAAGSAAAARSAFWPLFHRIRRSVDEQPVASPTASEQGWRLPRIGAWSAASHGLLGAPPRIAPGEGNATGVIARGRSSPPVELRVTPELSLTLGRSEEGVTLHVDAAPLQAAPAEAALPRLVAALRARGLTIAHANVQVTGGRPRSR